MAETRDHVTLELDGKEVRFSNPGKPFFAEEGITKLDVCEYYLAVADAILPHLRDRPTSMKRFPNGAGEDFFFQKRVPKGAPEWIEQMTVAFPSGRSANYFVCQDRAHLAWACNLGVIDWNPWAVRRPDGDHPCPLAWDEVPAAELGDFTLKTVPPRLAEKGDVSAGLHETAGSLQGLLDLAARDEAEGLGDAPWPPHFAKQRGEPRRVQPSKAKKKGQSG